MVAATTCSCKPGFHRGWQQLVPLPSIDLQLAGTTDKNHKHQQYDLSFVSSTGKDYTCRTSEKKSVKATDFVVGSSLNFQVDGNKGKVKTSAGKELNCTIVRVASVTARSTAVQ